MTDEFHLEVFHLDDQPGLVAYIPRAIIAWFCKQFNADMIGVTDDEEYDEETRFHLRLRACEEVFDTRYRIFADPEELLGKLRATPPEQVVLILLDQAIGTDSFAGSETYKKIGLIASQLLDRTFMLSAYPNIVLQQLEWHEGTARLIVKPADQELVVGHFRTNLVSISNPKPGARERLLKQTRP